MVDCDEAPAFARAHPGAKKEVPRLYASAWGGAPSSQVLQQFWRRHRQTATSRAVPKQQARNVKGRGPRGRRGSGPANGVLDVALLVALAGCGRARTGGVDGDDRGNAGPLRRR